jgi:SAM-dependent methyltransferase
MPDLWGAASTQYYRRSEIALLERRIGSLQDLRVLKLDLWNEAVNTRLLQWMEENGASVFGIDLSMTTVRRARRNFIDGGQRAGLIQADIRGLPFATGAFDFVYTMGTIEHIAEYESAIGEIHRVLRPGGRAVIGVPYKWDPFLRPLVVWLLELAGRYPYSPEKTFSSKELRSCVRRGGFTVLGRTGILFVPGVVRFWDLFWHARKSALAALTHPLLRIFEAAEQRWSSARRLGYLTAVVVEKPGPACATLGKPRRAA